MRTRPDPRTGDGGSGARVLTALRRPSRRRYAYQLTLGGAAVFYGGVVLLAALVAARQAPHLWDALPVPSWRHHVSNFALSGMLLLGAGTTALLEGRPRWQLWAWAGLVAAVNLVIESAVTVLNTPDAVDAAAGLAAVAVTVPVLMALERHGLRPR